MLTKKCNTCKKTKLLKHFSKGTYTKDGLQYKCIKCVSKYWSDNKIVLSYKNRVKSRTDTKRYSLLKSSAKSRKLEMTISFEDYVILINRKCAYCPKNDYGKVTGTSLDRIDSSKGYTIDNIVKCCKTCNQIKGQHSLKFLKKHLAIMLKNINNIKDLRFKV